MTANGATVVVVDVATMLDVVAAVLDVVEPAVVVVVVVGTTLRLAIAVAVATFDCVPMPN